MDRNQAKELLPIIQAFAEGGVIQVKDNNVWKDVDNNHNCVFLPDSYEYRIKLEPKYRPFKDTEECWQEMLKHQPFGWVKAKDKDLYSLVTTIITNKDKEIYLNGIGVYSLDEVTKQYTFADGTLFGILEKE